MTTTTERPVEAPPAPETTGPRRRPSQTRPRALLRPGGFGAGSTGPPRWARKLVRPPSTPRPPAPRDGRWWAGVAVMVLSGLLLGFVAHATVLSGLQHHREQGIAYDELRSSLALATTPIGQVVETEDGVFTMVPLGTPVALLEIPSIGVREVVVEGSSSEILRGGPGHRRDSVMPGQSGTAVVMGRQVSYGGPFGDLNRLQPGDDIIVTTGQGESLFRVLGLRRDGDPMPAELEADQGRLELQTADGMALFPTGVLHVDAELMSDPQPNPSRVLGTVALPSEEVAMGTTDGGWLTVFVALLFLGLAVVAIRWLWNTWGRWHAWLIGFPVVLAQGVISADAVMDALPNLL